MSEPAIHQKVHAPSTCRRAKPSRRRPVAIALGLALLLGACTNASEEDSGTALDTDPGGETAGVDADDSGDPGAIAAEQASTGAGSEAVAAAVAAERRQVFTATVSLRVDDLRGSAQRATAMITSLGGFAESESIDLGDAESATVTYRVPAGEFRTALGELDTIGELTEQSVQGDDVTAQYADLEGRVTTLRTSITRLQAFLAEATDVAQIGLLEGELTARESELESIESQRRALASQTELSSITVGFLSDNVVIADEDTLPSFLGGLEDGWDAAATAGAVLFAAVGFLVPFLPVAAVAYLLWRWRGRGRRTVTPDAPG